MNELIITEISITPIKPKDGLVGFCKFVVNNQFYCGDVAIYTSPKSSLGFRLVFPQKRLASGCVVDCFHPISKDIEQIVSQIIIKKYIELMDNFSNIAS